MASPGLQNEAVALQDKWFLKLWKQLDKLADQESKMRQALSKPLIICSPHAVAQL